MTKIGKLWTAAVAYVSLLVGAGLSVAGNLADTYRTRGEGVDGLDKVMAAGWPILVLLAIEMFVSPRWSPKRMFQAWRWLGCLAVGGMAMVVSWTHLHDLMSSRGQLPVVSVLGPLAIDGMAIMATGLILSTRTTMATPVQLDMDEVMEMAPDPITGQEWTAVTDMTDGAAVDRPMDVDVMATRPDSDLDAWQRGYEDALATAVVQQAESFLSESLPRRTRTSDGAPFPAEFADMAAAWDPAALARADMVRLSAAHFEVTERTVRRWLSAWADRPTSGAE